MRALRVALVHDWLTGFRGGEKVLEELATLYPEAELYTLIHVPGSTSARIEGRRIHTSPLNRLPGVARHYRKLLPFFPWAIERFRLQGYDLVLSTSHAVAKGVRAAGAPHLCYCFTPMRYVWSQADAYLGRGWKRAVATPLVTYLRRWDRRTSTADRVTRFVGISHTVVERIRAQYGRDASMIYPPVDVHRFASSSAGPEDYYLVVGGFAPYKREDLAIEAFRRLDRRLVVAGDGPSRARLEAEAPANVEFVGHVDDDALAHLYAGCRALVYPQDEDFGIVAVEAQAAGRPVIAFGRGGATETVVPLDAPSLPPTGVWFPHQTPRSLADAVEQFEARESEFDPATIRKHAAAFSPERFRNEIAAEVDALLEL